MEDGPKERAGVRGKTLPGDGHCGAPDQQMLAPVVCKAAEGAGRVRASRGALSRPGRTAGGGGVAGAACAPTHPYSGLGALGGEGEMIPPRLVVAPSKAQLSNHFSLQSRGRRADVNGVSSTGFRLSRLLLKGVSSG